MSEQKVATEQLKSALKIDKPIATQIRLPKSLYEDLRLLAFKQRISLNKMMVDCLSDFVINELMKGVK